LIHFQATQRCGLFFCPISQQFLKAYNEKLPRWGPGLCAFR